MKHHLLLLLLLQTLKVIGQSPTLELTYEYINVGMGEKRLITLLVNNRESLSIMGKADTIRASDDDFNIKGEDEAGEQVYRSVAKGELIFRDFVSRNGDFEPCLVKDPLKYTWTFESTARKIGLYECRSAKAHFRGRTYIAWYTEGLSVPHGPWKFTGLPGAMVEIRSDDESISFRLLKVSTTQRPIPRISDAKEISMNEFVTLEEGSLTDFINRLRAQLPRGAEMTVNSTGNRNLETNFNDVKR
jgi:GLPGLI family protein